MNRLDSFPYFPVTKSVNVLIIVHNVQEPKSVKNRGMELLRICSEHIASYGLPMAAQQNCVVEAVFVPHVFGTVNVFILKIQNFTVTSVFNYCITSQSCRS